MERQFYFPKDKLKQYLNVIRDITNNKNENDALAKIDEFIHEICVTTLGILTRDRIDANFSLNVRQIKQRVETVEQALNELSDFKGYQSEFLKLFGFGFENVDYEADVDHMILIED